MYHVSFPDKSYINHGFTGIGKTDHNNSLSVRKRYSDSNPDAQKTTSIGYTSLKYVNSPSTFSQSGPVFKNGNSSNSSKQSSLRSSGTTTPRMLSSANESPRSQGSEVEDSPDDFIQKFDNIGTIPSDSEDSATMQQTAKQTVADETADIHL